MGMIKTPRIGQNTIQSLTNSIKDINKKLPSLQVTSDLGGTSISHTVNGAVVHSKDIPLYPNVNLQVPLQYNHGAGYWDSYNGLQMYKLISGRLDPQTQFYYRQLIVDMNRELNQYGLSPDQQMKYSIIQCFPALTGWSNPYVLIVPYEYNEDVMQGAIEGGCGLSAAPGHWPLKVQWHGPQVVFSETTLSTAQPGLFIADHGYKAYAQTSSGEQGMLLSCIHNYEIDLNVHPGKGICYTTAPSSYGPGAMMVNAVHENGRGLLFWDGTKTITRDEEEYSYNTTYCSGLFYGDREHPATTTGTANFYNWYTSIKSEQYRSETIDPETSAVTYGDPYVYFSLFDITPCLSCGTSGGLVQDYEQLYNASSDGTRSPLNGVNRVITKLQMQPKYVSDLNIITGRPNSGSKVLCSDDGVLSWGDGGGSPGPGGNGMKWPNYNNLAGSGNLVETQCWYKAGSSGGHLRVSCRGGSVGGCNSIYISDSYGDTTNHIGMGAGNINTWIPIPIPPNKYFYIEFPDGTTRCWFDSDCSPGKYSEGDETSPDLDNIKAYALSAATELASAKSYAEQAKYDWDTYPDNHDPITSYLAWKEGAQQAADNALNASTAATTQNAALILGGNNAGAKYDDQAARSAEQAQQQADIAAHYYDLRVAEG